MSGVRVLHEEIVVADYRNVAVLASPMDRDALAKGRCGRRFETRRGPPV